MVIRPYILVILKLSYQLTGELKSESYWVRVNRLGIGRRVQYRAMKVGGLRRYQGLRARARARLGLGIGWAGEQVDILYIESTKFFRQKQIFRQKFFDFSII